MLYKSESVSACRKEASVVSGDQKLIRNVARLCIGVKSASGRPLHFFCIRQSGGSLGIL